MAGEGERGRERERVLYIRVYRRSAQLNVTQRSGQLEICFCFCFCLAFVFVFALEFSVDIKSVVVVCD
jgi:hypothetical protein